MALAAFQQSSRAEEQVFQSELSREDLLPETRERLRKVWQAKQGNRQSVEKVMKPFQGSTDSSAFQALLNSSGSKPLLYHSGNILRDWSWGDEENRASLDLVLKASPSIPTGSKVLVLGAGAARLAVDLFEAWKPALEVALDYNPLLLLSAKRVLAGASLAFHEFPQVPVSKESVAMLCDCSTDSRPDAGFQLLFADALHAPFVDRAFDVVVTPWFIDVNGEDPRVFFTRLNRLLPVGGRWVCFGPLGFLEKNPSRCYILDEILAIASEAGFEVEKTHEDWIPYLDSQDNRQRRIEKLVSFSATKKTDVSVRSDADSLPAWFNDTSLPVEMRPEFMTALQTNQLNFVTLSQIDGKRSIQEISSLLAQNSGLDPAVVSEIVKRLFRGLLRS